MHSTGNLGQGRSASTSCQCLSVIAAIIDDWQDGIAIRHRAVTARFTSRMPINVVIQRREVRVIFAIVCRLMAESHSGSNLWSSLKRSFSLRRSEDVDPDLRDNHSSEARKPEVLSSLQINDLPPLHLQNGSAHLQLPQAAHPGQDHPKSGGWIQRLSMRRRSSEISSPQQPSSPSERLASGDLQANGAKNETLSTDAACLGKSSNQNGLHSNSIAPERDAKGSESQDRGSKASLGSREAFLEEYDAATLELCNRLAGSTATSLGDTAFQEVAPWNREPGYLVCLGSLGRNAPAGFCLSFCMPKSTTPSECENSLKAMQLVLMRGNSACLVIRM